MSCDHKFIDSNVCLKCGWAPGDVLNQIACLPRQAQRRLLDEEAALGVSVAREALVSAALTVGRHWKLQDGVNAHYLNVLAEAVVSYDQAMQLWKLRTSGMYGKDVGDGGRSEPVDVVSDGGSGELVARGDGVDEYSDDVGVREDDAANRDGA